MLLRVGVIYRKMFCEKACAEIFLLMEKTIIGVSINKNNSVEKIIGRLVVQKPVSDEKFIQEPIYDRKASGT